MHATHEPPPIPDPDRGNCLNCGIPLLGDHCYACGQPVKGLVRHFSSLVGDFLDSVFDWDGRLPRTTWPLFVRPGHLTLEYFAGHRVRYVSPVRLFFFLAILTFFVGRLVVSFDEGRNPIDLRSNSAIEVARDIGEVEAARDKALAGIARAREELEAKTKDAPQQDRSARIEHRDRDQHPPRQRESHPQAGRRAHRRLPHGRGNRRPAPDPAPEQAEFR
ncbi:MAG: DUF3667 domain-containing protein [Luteimonas sp.]|nr:DUF3667 domain-containing protein [Luteimonas sp.]